MLEMVQRGEAALHLYYTAISGAGESTGYTN
jgi:hypothetical protein